MPHYQGDKQFVAQIEKLVRSTKNYILVKDPSGKSARYTKYFMIYFKKGDAETMQSRAFPWMREHVSVHLTYDERADAKYSGGVFINLLDYNKLLSLLPGVGKIVWKMRQTVIKEAEDVAIKAMAQEWSGRYQKVKENNSPGD